MIIGISGPAGSGKDTAAQFLIKNHNFVRIGLADKLKRICQGVFDFSEEQLWGPSSHRNAADKRYPRVHTWIPGLWTCACCGAKHIEKNTPCYLTPRYALQQLGTEWGRYCYYDVWIEDALRTAKKLLKEYTDADVGSRVLEYDPQSGLYGGPFYAGDVSFANQGYVVKSDLPEGVVFSDIRFKNELIKVREAGGRLIRLKRETTLESSQQQHASELEMRDIPDSDFDVVIDNHEGVPIEDLGREVTRAYEFLLE